jgi:hypothetical protein
MRLAHTHISPIGPMKPGRAVGFAKADPIRGAVLRLVSTDSAKRLTTILEPHAQSRTRTRTRTIPERRTVNREPRTVNPLTASC